jgi:thymidine phosphorylase
LAQRDGYLNSIDARQLGLNVCLLGGGRKASGDKVDHGVGIMSLVKIGQKIRKNEVMAIIQHHAVQDVLALQIADEMKKNTYKIKNERPKKVTALIQEVRCDWITK